MAGWLIQGVRGEGKTLCAVGRIKEYLLEGRPVATNLDLNLDELLPEDNSSLVYRLPDKPRIEDFEILPPAYDLEYKAEDKNGLLVLDELGTWLNTRSFKDKERLPILNWLFLSRKLHWDIIILAQDADQIDKQARTTLCDYLVQSSRLDRQKIPFFAPLLDFFYISSYMPKIHVYDVYYGFSMQQKPVDRWKITGKDVYDAYDTNQRFTDGLEVLNGNLIDMRATYTYLPACYLSGHVFKKRLLDQVSYLTEKFSPNQNKTIGAEMAKKVNAFGDKPKMILLTLFLVGFLSWRFYFRDDGVSIPTAGKTQLADVSTETDDNSVFELIDKPKPQKVKFNSVYLNVSPHTYVDKLLTIYRPRIATMIYSNETGAVGYIEFYEGFEYRERLSFSEMHALGVASVKKPYGIDLVTASQTVTVTSWPIPRKLEESTEFDTTKPKQLVHSPVDEKISSETAEI